MITTADFIKKVRCLINEAESDVSFSNIAGDPCSFDDTIAELLPQAVAAVQNIKPAGKRVNTRCMQVADAVVVDNGDGTGYMVLPDDFVSLSQLQMSGWERACSTMYAADSIEAAWQGNSNTRAGCSRPVCVSGVTPDGKRAVMLYPFPEGETLTKFLYEAAYNRDYGLDGYDESMAEAVAYMCASLLYKVFERYDASANASSAAVLLCGSSTIEKV